VILMCIVRVIVTAVQYSNDVVILYITSGSARTHGRVAWAENHRIDV